MEAEQGQTTRTAANSGDGALGRMGKVIGQAADPLWSSHYLLPGEQGAAGVRCGCRRLHGGWIDREGKEGKEHYACS
jgi:hypothetical protein